RRTGCHYAVHTDAGGGY
ncbi:hypothetical protein EC80586_3336, partial [Escherichia coli 8.0586]